MHASQILPRRAGRVPKPAQRAPRRWFSFLGAGAMVAVGYMDPGNWATDLSAGAQFGYRLLSVVLIASFAGMLLQWMASRLGLVSGRDLAQLCRERCTPRVARLLWITAEVAIIACDVAEVVGSAVALQLLLGVSLSVGVLLSALGTIALLSLRRLGARAVEIAVTALILFVAASLAAQLALAHPDWQSIQTGLRPSPELLRHAGMIWLAAGILGATVMPHNLYLHSALVKNHVPHGEASEIRRALRGINLDTVGALAFAFLVNAGLLVVAAAVFHAAGRTSLDDLSDAHRLLAPLVGAHWAAPLFAAALLACGLNSTVTGTLAGQVVMEGFTRLRVSPMRRALLTRALALTPALLAVACFGDGGSNRLLVGSQVVLSMQLPLAIIPMIRFASDRRLMGAWAVRGTPLATVWLFTAALVLLNLALLLQPLLA